MSVAVAMAMSAHYANLMDNLVRNDLIKSYTSWSFVFSSNVDESQSSNRCDEKESFHSERQIQTLISQSRNEPTEQPIDMVITLSEPEKHFL